MTNSPSLCDDILPYNKLRFEPVDKNYIKVVYVRLLLVYVILMACALFILLIEAESMPLMLIGAELVLAAAFVANMAFVRKIYSFKGYRLSEKDISYRSGIFFSQGYHHTILQNTAGKRAPQSSDEYFRTLLYRCDKRLAVNYQPDDYTGSVTGKSRRVKIFDIGKYLLR